MIAMNKTGMNIAIFFVAPFFFPVPVYNGILCTMQELFELPVQFRDITIVLPAELTAWGYSHRISVTLQDQVIIFEPDEERNYRAVLPEGQKPLPLEMVTAIAESLESVFK